MSPRLDNRNQLTAYEIRLGLERPEYAFDAAYRLTPSEERVCRLLAYGRTNRQIAEILDIAEATARHSVERVLLKLNVPSRQDVLEKARRVQPNT